MLRFFLFLVLVSPSATFAQNPAIPPEWGTAFDPQGFAQWTVEGNRLVALVTARPKEAAAYDPGTNFDAPRRTQEVAGDFTAELTVFPMTAQPEADNKAAWDWISAGLVVEADACTGVRLDRGFRREKRAATEAFVWDRSELFRMASQWVIDVPIDWERPIRYKVQRRGNRLLAWIGQDDKPFAPVYAHNIADWPAKVRVGPLVTSFTTAAVRAEFADFKITREDGAVLLERAKPDGPPALLVSGPEISGWGRWFDPMGVAAWSHKNGRLILDLAAVGSDFYAKGGLRNAPLVLREVEGDFTATLLIHTDLKPDHPARSASQLWQSVGLMLTSDGDQYLRFIFEMRGDGGRQPGMHLEYGAGTGAFSSHAGLSDWKMDQPLWLRLTRRGNRVDAAIKSVNGEWLPCDGFTLPDWPRRICAGVQATNLTGNHFAAEFESLTITPE